jgi:hypothetical protein
MMIDFQIEQPLSLAEAVKEIPGRPSLSTAWRWASRDKDPLETFVVGGRRFTTREAIGRFIARQNAGRTPGPASSSRVRAQQQEKAARIARSVFGSRR